MIYCPNGLMRYNDSIAIVDDIPLLSQWIKKSRSGERDFLTLLFKKEPGEKPYFLLVELYSLSKQPLDLLNL